MDHENGNIQGMEQTRNDSQPIERDKLDQVNGGQDTDKLLTTVKKLCSNCGYYTTHKLTDHHTYACIFCFTEVDV